MRSILIIITSLFLASHSSFAQQKFYLDDIEGFDQVETGWSTPRRRTNLSNKPISLQGKVYERGVCIHAFSEYTIALDGKTTQFHALVALDDMVANLSGNPVRVRFFKDNVLIWNKDSIAGGMAPIEVNLDLTGSKMFRTEIEGIGGTHHSHVDLADAWFTVGGINPKVYFRTIEKGEILTPPSVPKPRITGPKVFGVRPGSPVLFRFTSTGQKPMTFSVDKLPEGLTLNPSTGDLTGSVTKAGEYFLTVKATNALGSDQRNWKLKVGNILALTPPMGWNSWNCWGMSVDAEKVKRSAKGMVNSGLIDHGWTYINIDDGWQGEARNPETGEITSDPAKFPDMKILADDVHKMGLKIGLYSSPGTLTCGKRLGSLGHELEDAMTYSKWGYDYLKHDYCSYNEVVKQSQKNFYNAKRPYVIMGDALRKQNRDIILSLCQYGEMDVWKWGHTVNGSLWRTTGDIIDTWNSMRVIGFRQQASAPYTQPGRWADPDMLVVGRVGWGPNLHPTRLSPNEQYTHISLWCMLSSPLLLGCDLENLDPFTLNLLTNDEVLDINQDPLGIQATEVKGNDQTKWYVKKLENGDIAVAVFNMTESNKDESINWSDLKLEGKYAVRDLWRQKDLKTNDLGWKGIVPIHGVQMLRLSKK